MPKLKCDDTPELEAIEETLYVPLLGRIYADEHFPNILTDRTARELKDRLPANIKGSDTQTQYTLLAGAVRSANMDRCISGFLDRNPDGVIVELGCGLETAYFRGGPGTGTWYEVDLPDVIEYRRSLLGEREDDILVSADAFSGEWMDIVRERHPDSPVLVTASGLLYYFPRERVLGLLRGLRGRGRVEFVFDTVSSKGMARMRGYMKKVGHADAAMHFCVDDAESFAAESGARLIAEEPYYAHTDRTGLSFITSATMRVSDRFMMVKMVHIALE